MTNVVKCRLALVGPVELLSEAMQGFGNVGEVLDEAAIVVR